MKKSRIYTMFLLMLLPLMIGMLSAALTSKGMAEYGTMVKPPLSPPAWVFSVAWTILYLMMGLASYYILIAEAESSMKTNTLILYMVQLGMNFFWSILFFGLKVYFIAFLWLLGIWGIVIFLTWKSFKISKKAVYLLIPYICWLTFAAYLNLGSYIIHVS